MLFQAVNLGFKNLATGLSTTEILHNPLSGFKNISVAFQFHPQKRGKLVLHSHNLRRDIIT